METGVHRTAARGVSGWPPTSRSPRRPPAGRLLQSWRTSRMKAFLKCSEGFIFLRKYTTIGRHENSDLVLKYPDIDNHHALIEFNEEDGSFILQDFNSLSGTFVNNCHIQNVAVKLKPGDILRFGAVGLSYELIVEFLPHSTHYSPGPKVLDLTPGHHSTQFPFLHTRPMSAQRSWSQELMEGTQPRPPPEKRPFSAGGRRMLAVSSDPVSRSIKQGLLDPLLLVTPFKKKRQESCHEGKIKVWTTGESIWTSDEGFFNPDRRTTISQDKGRVMYLNQSHAVNLPFLEHSHLIKIPQAQQSHYINIPNLEQQTRLVNMHKELPTQDDIIQHLGQEISRLSGFEIESKHKDTVIANLQNKVATMSQKLMILQTTPSQAAIGKSQILEFPERDIDDKKYKIQSLKEQKPPGLVQQPPSVSKPQLEQFHQVSTPNSVGSKDGIIEILEQEVSRLSSLEVESKHKDTMIANLQNEMADMSQKLMLLQKVPSQVEIKKSQELNLLDWDEEDKKVEAGRSLEDQTTDLPKGQSNMLFHTLAERNLEITHLKAEWENLKKDKERCSELLATLQKDIGLKDILVHKLKQEVDRLKNENQEKDYQLSAITSRCSKLKEELKKDELETKNKELKSCKTYIKDLEHQLKLLGEQLQKSCNEQCAISQTLKEKNKLEQFRSQIIEAIYGRGKLPQARIVTNQQLVEVISTVMEDNFNLQQKEIMMKSWQQNYREEALLAHRDRLKTFFDDCQTCLKMSCCGNDLRKQLSDLQNLPVEPSGMWLQQAIVEILKIVLCWVEEIEQLLKDVGIELSNTDKGFSLYLIKFLENHKKTMKKNQELQAKINSIQESYHTLLQKIHDQTLEHEKQLQEKIKQLQEKQEEETQVWKDSVTQEKNKAKAAVEEEKKKVQDLENHLRKLKQEMESKSEEGGVLSSHLNEALTLVEESQRTNSVDQKEKETLTLRLSKALDELSEARQKQILLGEQILEQQETLKIVQENNNLQKRSLEIEIIQYKEQVRQHSQTIVTLEERLQKVNQQNKDIEQKIFSLKENIPVPKERKKDGLLKNLTTGRSYDHLMEEFMVAQKQLLSQHELIIALKTDLNRGQAKMTDLKAEYDKNLKTEIEQNVILIQQQEKEMIVLQDKLVQISNLVEKKNKEIESLKAALKISKEAEKAAMLNCDVGIQVEIAENDFYFFNQEASSFIELGTKCKGFRHEEIIQRQKKALSELREQIKELEKTGVASAGDVGLESSLESKKSKLGKNPKISEKDAGLPCLPNIDQRVGNKTNYSLPSSHLPNFSTEKLSKLDLVEALDLSEKLYMDMSKTIGSLMSIKDMSGHVSIKFLPQKERERIGQLRQKDLDLVFDKISQLKNRLDRKEDLLREYERENEALRQSKIPMQVYQEQMNKLEDEIYKEAEEKALLKEALDRTEQQLSLEKRMNRCIKQQKERLEEQEQRGLKEASPSNSIHKERQFRLHRKHCVSDISAIDSSQTRSFSKVPTCMDREGVLLIQEFPSLFKRMGPAQVQELKTKKIVLKTDQEKDLSSKELPHRTVLEIIFPKTSEKN
ncbi:forkhead-associated domain-containing protein 1 isoform X5 [Monodelphis domestica]|uniref:forkhead-associated domain-containing protein 1 isoform X5 n=1 Tax=Monodelphis domestica TaxID=13616 RepID=UPI0024E1FAC8|nr:forkhead-associated domain-containing protein 1 isoform X5 [Monodelphis domestica]